MATTQSPYWTLLNFFSKKTLSQIRSSHWFIIFFNYQYKTNKIFTWKLDIWQTCWLNPSWVSTLVSLSPPSFILSLCEMKLQETSLLLPLLFHLRISVTHYSMLNKGPKTLWVKLIKRSRYEIHFTEVALAGLVFCNIMVKLNFLRSLYVAGPTCLHQQKRFPHNSMN